MSVGVFLVTATSISLAVVSAIQFTYPEYTVREDRGIIAVCLETNDSEVENDTNTTVTFSTQPESAGKTRPLTIVEQSCKYVHVH